MLAYTKNPPSFEKSNHGDSSNLLSDLDSCIILLDYLAVECMENTFVSLAGQDCLVQKCLDSSTSTDLNEPLIRHYHDLHSVIYTNGDDGSHLSEGKEASSVLTIGIPMHVLISKLDLQLCSLRWRKHIMDLVQDGHTQTAKKLIMSNIPGFLNGHRPAISDLNGTTIPITSIPISARLDCQSFVELVRLGDHKQTIHFCQSNLSPYLNSSHDPPFAKHLVNHVCGLLAYTDPFNCPLSEYMQLVHRFNLARDLNRLLLSYLMPQNNHCAEHVNGGASILERLVRQVISVNSSQGRSIDLAKLDSVTD